MDSKENSTPGLNVFRQVPNGAEWQTSAVLCSGYRATNASHLVNPFLML